MPVGSERNGAGDGRTRVVDYIAERLVRRGVRHVFGVDGANIEDFYDAAHFCPDLTAVVAKHEFSAVAMADAYSRSGGAIGVVCATSGGGALNTVPGLGESFASRVPVLALIGQPPTVSDGLGSFQDTSGVNGALPGEALFAAVSVFCERVVTANDIMTALPRALSAATSIGGPAVLLLPKDIQQAVVEPTPDPAGDAQPEAGDLAALVRLLGSTEGPVTIIAGDQVARDDARAELETLRAVLQATVATVPDAKDAAAEALGVVGVMGHPTVVAALAGSALCLAIGTRLPLMARGGLDAVLGSLPIASLGAEAPYLPCTHVQSHDLRAALSQLATALTRGPDRTPAARPAPGELTPPEHVGAAVRYRDAMRVVDGLLPQDADIVVDAGNIGAAAIHWLPARRDGRFLVALGMGGMGYSFGAGIGMAFARNRRTVVIAGDGSFFMHGMEIHTALHYRLPVTFLLFDNHAHAMCVTREQLFYGDRYSYNRFGPSRLGAGLSAMFPALPAVDVTDIGELGVAVTAALDADGPSVVSVECSADEIPPFTAFLNATTQLNSRRS
ncbi:thiamine pyrophosphate-binding protein [Mycolicibacterium aichiense]|uniref:acetolactate synthase n=1 Tax=Mycolicibacterium aichiense TaxID=1799 RepID=A0AAD1HK94_9MYCO|nr:thiamine pyrophosphate-binding protein [Mycolicibacterium aichiense]MCV7017746.1 thiamine pyrophosphate-binding protein [Mycolicibacterium aichiense]BBX06641.1 acetolactate synthase [Mycolicibacterium aichiense]STZ24023.1 thiamine pyrophosphate-dependent enzyme, possible carboligase or decarboxylase [Mycolicibacterium aichiense]